MIYDLVDIEGFKEEHYEYFLEYIQDGATQIDFGNNTPIEVEFKECKTEDKGDSVF